MQYVLSEWEKDGFQFDTVRQNKKLLADKGIKVLAVVYTLKTIQRKAIKQRRKEKTKLNLRKN